MQNIDGLDSRVKVCDGYMFSAPIVSDMDTAKRETVFLRL